MKRLLVISALLLAFSCTKAHPQPKSFNEAQTAIILIHYMAAMEQQSKFQSEAMAYNTALTEQLKQAGFPPLCQQNPPVEGDCSNVQIDMEAKKANVTIVPRQKPQPQAQPQSQKK